MVAKYMRCSVRTTMRMPPEDFEQAYIAAAAINKALPFLIEQQRKKGGNG